MRHVRDENGLQTWRSVTRRVFAASGGTVQLRLSLNFCKLYIRPNWSVKRNLGNNILD